MMMEDAPVYIVSGFARSGSSMMMDCLHHGGLPTYYDQYADDLMRMHSPSDYDPNPNGFYQYGKSVDAYFYEENKGKVIKVYFSDLTRLPKGNYRMVFIRRNPEEIRASMHRWTPFVSWNAEEAATYFYDKIVGALSAAYPEMLLLDYADVVSHPLREFEKLRNWGIDVKKAAARVDPALYRLRLEPK